jgi:homogentisate 1,2-dioxygenase
MFETTYILNLTKAAAEAAHLEKDYVDCWATLPKLFKGGDEAEGR